MVNSHSMPTNMLLNDHARNGFLMQVTGIILSIGSYLAMLIFFGNFAARISTWLKSKPVKETAHQKLTVKTVALAICDILSFRRLLIANDVLWIGEWAFHISFVVVILRHLRFFLNPVPGWVVALQIPGIIAGYVLPIALVYIFIVKCLIEKKKYVSSYNFFLLTLIFFLSVSGLLMKTIYRPDIVSVKDFSLGIVTFGLTAVPSSFLFMLHFIAVLTLIVNLPTHIFAAPLVLMGALEREEEFKKVIHDR